MERKSAYMQLTRKCNNKCIFCSNPTFDKELTLDQLKKRILYYKEKGITEIFFSGGEPTESKLLPNALQLSSSAGIEPKIITNGINLSDLEYVKLLKENGLRNLHISIHSHIEKDYDLLSNKQGNFKKVIAGIENCIKQDMKVYLNSTINSVNAVYLSDFVSYMIDRFPEIPHYVFNNLDPGNADGEVISRAWENKWIIAKLVQMELELAKTCNLLIKNSKTFRIERVPLCYMQGFEEFSTDTRRIAKEEPYICMFIMRGEKDILVNIRNPLERRTKGDCCKFCKLNLICGGLDISYAEIFGTSELFPSFEDPKTIIKKIIDN